MVQILEQEACVVCKYFKALKADNQFGKCLRHPPSIAGSFPQVYVSDWCGEFTRKPEEQDLTE